MPVDQLRSIQELLPPATGTLPPQDVARILLVDDDRKLSRLLTNLLSPYGYSVTTVHDGIQALRHVTPHSSWDLIILDIMLPGLDGFEILKEIRKKTPAMIMMLTARGDESDRIVGLEIGADDYVPKTFSSRELLARIRALLRRAVRPATVPHQAVVEPDENVLSIGDLKIYANSYQVFAGDTEVTLTVVEFNILLCLARAKGKVCTREQLMVKVRDREFNLSDRTIDVHVSTLRRKLGGSRDHSRYIKTIRSLGYMAVDSVVMP
jgi:DNA-binding response OmpR family regulator